jgi:hypothetical protein
LLLGLALVVLVVATIALTPDGREVPIPEAIESVSPADQATVLSQTDLEVNMQAGYDVEVFVDGIPIPAGEIDLVEATGVYRWRPGPGKTFEAWAPGLHTVQITWEKVAGPPEVGEYRWVFRVQ